MKPHSPSTAPSSTVQPLESFASREAFYATDSGDSFKVATTSRHLKISKVLAIAFSNTNSSSAKTHSNV